MHIRFWRPSLKGQAALQRLVAGAMVLALVVGTLTTSLLFTRHAAAAAAQPQTRVSVQTQSGMLRLEVLQISQGVVYHKWSDNNGGSWSAWTAMSGSGLSFIGTPSAASDGVGHLFVFARAKGDGITNYDGIYYNTYNNNTWAGWSVLHTGFPQTFSDPAVTSSGSGRIDVFDYLYNIGASPALEHWWHDSGGWNGPEIISVGGPTGLAAVSWGPGRVDVFARGGASELEHLWYDQNNGGWHGWENLGGSLASSPSAASPGSGRLNIFARGSDGHLWGIWFAGGWGGWGDLGCCVAGDVTTPVAVTSRVPMTLDVFVIGTDHALYREAYDYSAGGWAAWQFIDHAFDYTTIATTTWVPVAPPPPDTPTPTPNPNCGGASQPPCILPQ